MRSQGWAYISSEVTYRLSPRDLCKRLPPTPFPPKSWALGGKVHWRRHWPLEDSCTSHIPREHLELARRARGKARETVGECTSGHSCPACRVQ